MSFSGSTYTIPCSRGGFSGDKNFDLVPPYNFVAPSRNINLHTGGRRKRGGTSKVSGTAVSGTPRAMGMIDFLPSVGSQFQVFAGDDGAVYKNTTTSIKTGMSTVNKFHFEIGRNTLYVLDGSSTPQSWDGVAASTSNITASAADWTASNQPSVAILHRRGLSERMFYLAVNGFRDKLYYSKNGVLGDVSGTGDAGSLRAPTGDAYGLVAGVEYGNRLIVFGKKKALILNDVSDDIAEWGMELAQWSGGAAHQRLVVKTPTDVVCMTDDGEIYSISAVQSYGDYKLASLTRPAFMDIWIRENLDLSYIDDFHATYDPELRAIKFFVVRSGEMLIDTALVYYIDRPPEEAWTIHDGQEGASGYSASCSASVKTGTTYKVYTGDYDGYLWKLEQENRNDDSGAYYAGFKTPPITFDNPRQTKMFRNVRVVTEAEGLFYLQVKWWVDGDVQETQTISLAGTGAVFGTDVFDTGVFGGNDLIDAPGVFGNMGKRIQIEVFNTNANEDFFVSQVMIDFRPLGVRP